MNIIEKLKQKKEQKRRQKEREENRKKLIKLSNDFWNECEEELKKQR